MKDSMLVGKTIKDVKLDQQESIKKIKFITSTHEEFIVQAEEDCCSRTWIESIKGLENVIGQVVTEVKTQLTNEEETDWGYMLSYEVDIKTNKGKFIIDFKNSRNSFYPHRLIIIKKEHLFDFS